jgi:two-component system, NtrC family, response regulator PilR
VIEIALPALRDRREDLPQLTQALLARIAADSGESPRVVSAAMMSTLQRSPLTGNVRELENILHRALALSDGAELEIEAEEMRSYGQDTPLGSTTPVAGGDPLVDGLPAAMPSDLQSHLDTQEKAILLQALTECGFNRTAAAARLGISLRQIRYRMVRLGIDAQIPAQSASTDA